MPVSAWLWDTRARPTGASAVLDALRNGGVDVRRIGNAEDALGAGIVLFDSAVRGGERVRELGPGRRVLAVAAPGSSCAGAGEWELLRQGAADVARWDEMPDPGASIGARLTRWAEIDDVLRSDLVSENLVGRAPAWLAFLELLAEAALFTEAPILITGETGTGKELAARFVNTIDRKRAGKELIVVDCTTIVPELAGSELFGHERGAFTGAVGARDGAFALAHGGTLFLDEVGELPLALQAQLLRAVQEKTYKRVGGNTWQTADFRLICATNRDLKAEVAQGRFRADLYYRIAGVTARAPALRERQEDVILLAEHFLREWAGEDARFSTAVREFLESRTYSGNVRDLRQLVHAISLRHQGNGPVTIGAIPVEERAHAPCPTTPTLTVGAGNDFEACIRRAMSQGMGLKEIGRIAEETAMAIALKETGSVREAASRLAVTERAIQMRRAARRDENGANGHHNGTGSNGEHVRLGR